MKTNKAPENIYIFEDELQREDHVVKYGVNQDKGIDGLIEYTRTDAFAKKAKEAFCKATCNGCPPRSTCTSLGTCREYDNFVKFLKEE